MSKIGNCIYLDCLGSLWLLFSQHRKEKISLSWTELKQWQWQGFQLAWSMAKMWLKKKGSLTMNSLPEASYFWLVLREKMLIAFFSQEGSVLRELGESYNSFNPAETGEHDLKTWLRSHSSQTACNHTEGKMGRVLERIVKLGHYPCY